MNNINKHIHQSKIIDQFSRQAIPFTKVPGHYDAVQILIELSEVSRSDNVLDVACGPGIVACEFARHAGHVNGIDITPAMIEQAEKRRREHNLVNLTWTVGDAVPLPYDDNTFSLVITRYSFHHLLSPEKALSEMIRVCRQGGRVMVADVAVESRKSESYDLLEVMRDPSHTHAMTCEEFTVLFQKSGLLDCRQSAYGVEIDLESQLNASFPNPGDEAKLRDLITNDIGIDTLGINARKKDDKVMYTVPVGVYVGWKVGI
jgi:ubiquinone/menaquinone biosynthesis C-methylase UbiE